MTHTLCTPRRPNLRADLLILIMLSGVLGFSLGQNWERATPTSVEAALPSEDWHGNVRRSTWPD